MLPLILVEHREPSISLIRSSGGYTSNMKKIAASTNKTAKKHGPQMKKQQKKAKSKKHAKKTKHEKNKMKRSDMVSGSVSVR